MRVGSTGHLLRALAGAVFWLTGAAAGAADFYAAPNGSPSGNGSFGSPWDLQTALNQPSAVHPGDTIWLRGGTYTGIHTSYLNGTTTNPIIVRQYPGERATLDGGNSNGVAILSINGSYTWYWGFEVMSSDPRRVSAQSGSWPTDIYRGDGIDSGSASSDGIKLINLTIHDTKQGVSAFSSWSNSEVSGCLIYYNGWTAPDRGHGHGIYTQNQVGTKTISGNVMFSGFGYGIHAYGSAAAYPRQLHVQGNTIFVSGTLDRSGLAQPAGRRRRRGAQPVGARQLSLPNGLGRARVGLRPRLHRGVRQCHGHRQLHLEQHRISRTVCPSA